MLVSSIKMVGKVLGCCEDIEAIAMCGKTNADKITSIYIIIYILNRYITNILELGRFLPHE